MPPHRPPGEQGSLTVAAATGAAAVLLLAAAFAGAIAGIAGQQPSPCTARSAARISTAPARGGHRAGNRNATARHGNPPQTPASVRTFKHGPDRPGTAGASQPSTAAAASSMPRRSAAAGPLCREPARPGPLPPGTAGKVIAYATAQIGKPYQWGATGPGAFDCSGLAMMAFRAAGITIPRTSQQQWAYGRRIPAARARPGDLVFFAGTDGTMTSPGHVGIIIPGHDMMIDAPHTGQDVSAQSYAGSTDLAGYTRP